MSKAFSRFLGFFGLFLCLAGAGLWAWNAYAPAEKTLSYAWYLFGFFALTTLGVHAFLLRSGEAKPQVFIRRFMAITSAKMFIYMILAVLIAFSDKAQAKVSLFHFLVFYFVFTAYEVVSLYSHFRPQKN
ncbi:MAG: hypothetical protein ACRCYO_00920 [Bacteroidia bacterium]